MSEVTAEVAAFLDGWVETDDRNKAGFQRLYALLQGHEHGRLEFHPRPGVTYSLRGIRSQEEGDRLYVMVDVIEDEPRWLSVCFYGAMVSDPQEKGAFVPGGLLGEDAVCFDLDTYADEEYEYVEQRIEEAYTASGGNA